MDQQSTIIIVDDHEPSREVLQRAVTSWGFSAILAGSYRQALEEMEHHEFDLAFIDYKLPDGNGLDLLSQILKRRPGVPVIIITGYGDIELAVKAVKAGAYDFLTKPIKLEVLESLVSHALEEMPLPMAPHVFPGEIADELEYDFEGMVGRSTPMKRLYSLIRKIAPTEVTVLLEGESGTGKELAADAIHALSRRKPGPLIKLHCAALSEGVLESELFGHEKGAFTGAMRSRIGRFEAAHGGTLFLDEISEIPFTTQVKLLRVMQEQRFERVGSTETIGVDVRIIGATNANLAQKVKEGRFRDDLYFRFKVITIKIPPLRDRNEDILLLASFFLKFFSNRYQKANLHFAPQCAGILLNYPWPGNVRELRNLIEAAVVLSEGLVISSEEIIAHLDPTLYKETAALHKRAEYRTNSFQKPSKTPSVDTKSEDEIQEHDGSNNTTGLTEMERMEMETIRKALADANGNRTHAAKSLGIGLRTLQRKIKLYGLN